MSTAPLWLPEMRFAVLAASLVLASLPAWGQAAPASKDKPMAPATARANAQKPIDITADRLDVDQNGKLATFSGNVRAVQADLTLRTPTLKVYYDQTARKGGKGGRGGSAPSFIQRLEAEGGVVIEAPGENAKGRRGTYDVASRVMRLYDDVVLTRGSNVVRGQRLTIDFDTGQSRVDGGEAGGKGRVHGTFVPTRSAGNDGKGR